MVIWSFFAGNLNWLIWFSHHFVDLAELIQNINILMGFDKIFKTIFYFTHTNTTNLLIRRIYCNICLMVEISYLLDNTNFVFQVWARQNARKNPIIFWNRHLISLKKWYPFLWFLKKSLKFFIAWTLHNTTKVTTVTILLT